MDFVDAFNNLSVSGKWQQIENAVIFNCVLSLALCVSSLFTNGVWGFGISLQLATTSLMNAAYNVYLFKCVNTRETAYVTPDFLGGVSLMINVLMLQTVCMWYDLAGGLRFTSICVGALNLSPEKAVTTLAALSWLTHSLVCFLAFRWRDELDISDMSAGTFDKPFQPVSASSEDTRGATIIESGSYQQGVAGSGNSQFVIDNDDAQL